MALAWSIRDGNVIAIPESGDAAHIQDNAAALTVRLDDDDLAAIDAVSPAPIGKTALDIL